jgi:ABC-type polysaccharide/polyol phosphate export permease
MLLANSGVNLISLAPIIILFLVTLVIDRLFQTQTILISAATFLSWVLAVMSLYQVVQNTIENAVASKELFRKLYDEKIIQIYEKAF